MHYLTTEEQERLAYAEGYTETAAVLARLDDAHRALGQATADLLHLDELQAELGQATADLLHLDELQAELDDVTDERDDALAALDPLGCRLHDARAELELTRDQVKALRSALMAIEAEVPAHIRQFIREVLA